MHSKKIGEKETALREVLGLQLISNSHLTDNWQIDNPNLNW